MRGGAALGRLQVRAIVSAPPRQGLAATSRTRPKIVAASDERTPVALPAKRRVRDHIAEREATANPMLTSRYELQNLLLFVDDDLRETARAMENIEGFL